MPTVDLHNLTPHSLATLAYAAWGALLAGLVLWLFGVAIARIAVAAFIGTLAAALAILLATHFQIAVPPLTAGIIGFLTGAIAGAVGFRMLQGFTLALVLSLTAAGLYYHFHAPTIPAPALTQLESPNTTPEMPALNAPALLTNLKTHLLALSPQDQQRMALAAAGAALIALILAFGFPKMTTAAISAVVGSLFILTAANLFMLASHTATLPPWWPSSLPVWGLMLALLACTGVAIQYRFFIRPSDKPQVKTA